MGIVKLVKEIVLKYSAFIGPILLTTGMIMFMYYMIKAYISGNFIPIGTSMVNSEITIIPHIIYAKPITIFIFVIFIGYVLTLISLTERAIKWSETDYIFIDALAFFSIFLSLYEIFFNFSLWTALIASISDMGIVLRNIDLLYNKFPKPELSCNLVFATKIFYLIFLMGIVTLYFTNLWRRHKRS